MNNEKSIDNLYEKLKENIIIKPEIYDIIKQLEEASGKSIMDIVRERNLVREAIDRITRANYKQ